MTLQSRLNEEADQMLGEPPYERLDYGGVTPQMLTTAAALRRAARELDNLDAALDKLRDDQWDAAHPEDVNAAV